MLESIPPAPPDAILGLTEAFKADPNPRKINLGVGVYLDETGKTPTFRSVRKAESAMLEKGGSKSYLPIEGSPEYAAAALEMLFGAGHDAAGSGRAMAAHTPGGTGALRVAADFLRKFRPDAKVWLSDETWANHPQIFGAAGFATGKYAYYDAEGKCLRFDAMRASIESIPRGDILLLQISCHNPTGVDLSAGQWEEIAGIAQERGIVPLIDFAYQGLAAGIRQDAAALDSFARQGREALIASSFSKNFGLYNERVGALTLIAPTADAAKAAFTQIKAAIRANYSNPPSHGGAIVTTILRHPDLRADWEAEVGEMRDRIHRMRSLFVQTLRQLGAKGDFSFIERQNGMFSYSGLTPEQVKALREKRAIYIVGNGRINVAGMTTTNMEPLCRGILEVL